MRRFVLTLALILGIAVGVPVSSGSARASSPPSGSTLSRLEKEAGQGLARKKKKKKKKKGRKGKKGNKKAAISSANRA